VNDGAELASILRNTLSQNDLPFRDFVEIALYHPQFGYYNRQAQPEADYTTSPRLSPLFGSVLSGLVREFASRSGDGVSTIADVGAGDGTLIHSLSAESALERTKFYGVDRTLERLKPEVRQVPGLGFVRGIDELPRGGAHLIFANELFDAFPFARLVQRDEHLHELWVTDREGQLDWTEHEAPGPYEDYFAARGITLDDGQFADVSLEWEAYYRDICSFVQRGLIVTFDYGFPQDQLFKSRVRRFGTAASYRSQRVTRDLLAYPGTQDITAHINFTDLIRAGEESGFTTLFFDRQAKFLLALGGGEHPLIQSEPASVDELQQKENARRLILPDGIGEDIRVLVQGRGMGAGEWGFQRKLY
jgi:SAM-dependent MidA family methyltransferase